MWAIAFVVGCMMCVYHTARQYSALFVLDHPPHADSTSAFAQNTMSGSGNPDDYSELANASEEKDLETDGEITLGPRDHCTGGSAVHF